MTHPKIELHVHLEGTVRPALLFTIARRNGVGLPAATPEELQERYRFRDFAHFLEVWWLTVTALRRERDFREVVVAYAAEAAAHGAVYLEAIFAPTEAVREGTSWDEVFAGYCDGAQEAWERHGVRVRLTPDIGRSFSMEEAEQVTRHAIRHRERGVVGLGLGGLEAGHPPEPFAPLFAWARDAGLASLPHAGEVAGAESVRGALDALGADRLRHGIRAIDDPGLVRHLADRGVVLDVCPVSNLRTGAVRSLAEHPLPRLVAAGVPCSLATDDPAMFDTDLGREHEVARGMGLDARDFYAAGVAGAPRRRDTPRARRDRRGGWLGRACPDRLMGAAGAIAAVTTLWGVAMAASPVLQIRRIRRERSSRGVSALQIAVLLVGFALWLLYGVAEGSVP